MHDGNVFLGRKSTEDSCTVGQYTRRCILDGQVARVAEGVEPSFPENCVNGKKYSQTLREHFLLLLAARQRGHKKQLFCKIAMNESTVKERSQNGRTHVE